LLFNIIIIVYIIGKGDYFRKIGSRSSKGAKTLWAGGYHDKNGWYGGAGTLVLIGNAEAVLLPNVLIEISHKHCRLHS